MPSRRRLRPVTSEPGPEPSPLWIVVGPHVRRIKPPTALRADIVRQAAEGIAAVQADGSVGPLRHATIMLLGDTASSQHPWRTLIQSRDPVCSVCSLIANESRCPQPA